MIWRGVLGFVGFWFSFYALSFTPISLNPGNTYAAWWAIPYALTFGAMAVGSLVLVVSAFVEHRLDGDKRVLAWLLSRVT